MYVFAFALKKVYESRSVLPARLSLEKMTWGLFGEKNNLILKSKKIKDNIDVDKMALKWKEVSGQDVTYFRPLRWSDTG